MNFPSRIYHVDETGISLEGHAPWVVALKGQKMIQDVSKQKSKYGYSLRECQWTVHSTFCYL